MDERGPPATQLFCIAGGVVCAGQYQWYISNCPQLRWTPSAQTGARLAEINDFAARTALKHAHQASFAGGLANPGLEL